MQLTSIFYHVDNFCKLFEKEIKKNSILKKKRNRERALSLSDVMTIMIYFHHSGYKNFKSYYCKYVLKYLKTAFSLVSYNRFVELQQEAVLPLMLFVKVSGMRKCTGISFIDSFQMKVSHIRRASGHKTFKNLASKGKTSVGWFFGFKVHFVISHDGEILDFTISTGKIADNDYDIVEKITRNIYGLLFGDKGYISTKIFKNLYQRGTKLVTKIRSNMKNKLVNMQEKILLKKRGVIESVIAILKEEFLIEHSRHRSRTNFLGSICSAMAAYVFRDKKPSIKLTNRTLLASC